MTPFSYHIRNHNTIWCYSSFANIIHFPQHLPLQMCTAISHTLPLSLRIVQIMLSSASFSPPLPHLFTSSSLFRFFFLIFWKVFPSPFWRHCLFHPLLPTNTLIHQICFLVSLVSLLVLTIMKIFMTHYKICLDFKNTLKVTSNPLHSDNSPRGCLYSIFPFFFLAAPCGFWELKFLNRDWICACSRQWGLRVLPVDHQGIPEILLLLIFFLKKCSLAFFDLYVFLLCSLL